MRNRRGRTAALAGAVSIALLTAFGGPGWAATGGNAGADHKEAGAEAAELEQSLNAFIEPRTAPNGAVSPDAYPAAAAYARSVAPSSGTAWNEIGPYNFQNDDPNYVDPVNSNSGAGWGLVSGRITALAVRSDGQTVFAGGADGGVWKSTDAGQHWTPVFDDQATLSIGALAIDEGNPTGGYTVYVGTGEANTSSDSYAGVGVLKSADGGTTWTQVGGDQLNGALIWRIVVDPTDHRVFAATSHGLFRMLPGETTWTRVLGVDVPPGNIVQNMVTDVVLKPGTGGGTGDVVAVVGWREGAATNGFYESTDGGSHFTRVTPTGYVSPKAQGRVTLAYSADGKRLYAMVQDPKALINGLPTIFEGLYVSKSGSPAGPFNQIASPSKLAASGSAQKPGEIGPGYKPGVQAWYNQFLAVDPGDPGHVYMGLEEVYETTDGGTSWTTLGPYWNFSFRCFSYTPLGGTCAPTTHPDQHAIAIAGGNVWVGNDGGVYSRSITDHGVAGWANLNATLGTLQFYYANASQPPTGPMVIYGGLQDNGTGKVIVGGPASIPFGGDGGDVIVDPHDPNKVATEYVNLAMAKSLNGGQTWTDIAPPDPLPRFIAPFEADKANPDVWVAGGNYVWVSNKGFGTTAADWQPAFNQGPGRSTTAVDSVGGTIYAAWCGPCNPSFTSGLGFRSGISTNFGGTWHQLTTLPLTTRFPTAVTVDPADAAHAYVTYSGYSRRWIIGPLDPGVGHVFETTDGGATWTDISGDLVDAPANDIVVVGSHLVVGTDVGVFVSGLHGGTWLRLGIGLPTVVVNDLSVTPNGDLIIAATHGRGLWDISTGAVG